MEEYEKRIRDNDM